MNDDKKGQQQATSFFYYHYCYICFAFIYYYFLFLFFLLYFKYKEKTTYNSSRKLSENTPCLLLYKLAKNLLLKLQYE